MASPNITVSVSQNPTFNEGDAAVDLFAGVVTADTGDADPETFSSLTLTVGNVVADDYLVIGLTSVKLVQGDVSIPGLGASAVAHVTVQGSNATVKIDGLALNNGAMGGLVDGLTFGNSNLANPTEGIRTITLTEVTDNGISDNTNAPNISATVDVKGVNDAPQLLGDLTGSVTRGGDYTVTSADLSYSDVDDTTKAITFVVTEPRGGYVTVRGSRELKAFSTADINAGNVVFHHDGTSPAPFFVVIVADDGGAQAPSQSFTINVIDPPPPPPANSAPIVADDIADQVIQSGSVYSFQIPTGSFVDPDGNALTYSVGALPAWLSFNAQTQTFTGTPATTDAGAVAVTVTASDGSLSASDTFNMIVTNPGNPSNSIELSNREVAENSKKNTVVGEFSSASSDGAPFTFELIKNPDHAFKIVGDELRVRKGADLDFETQASYKIKVEMHDADGKTVQDTFRIKLTDVEESPKGTRHDDRLVGDALDNELDGKHGDDKLIGNGEADIFVLGERYGRDIIIDFDPEEGDKIDLSDAVGIRGFVDLMKHHVTDIGDHVKITAHDDSVLVIKHFEPEDLAKDMFLF